MNTENFDLSTFAGRLCYAMKETGHENQSVLARKIGVSPQNLQYLTTKGKGSVHSSKIAEEIGINAKWLVSGEGEMIEKNALRINESVKEYNTDGLDITTIGIEIQLRKIPVVGYGQLGDDGYHEHLEFTTEAAQGYLMFPTADDEAYAIRSLGMSMYPRYMPGEYIVISPRKIVEPGDEVFLKTTDGRAMVKIFSYKRNGYVYFDSINTDNKQIVIQADFMLTMHKVTGRADQALYRVS